MTEAGKNKQVRRRKRHGGKKTLHYILITIFLLAAGAALSLTVFFKIESVTAVGADKYPPGEIVAASGISAGDNLFRVDVAAVKDKLMAEFPYIEEVAVRHKLPNAIQLEITQCKPAGVLSDSGEFLVITREGKVLERGLLFIPENVPLIKGIDTENVRPGGELGESAAAALRMLDYLFKAAEETDFGEITNVDLTDIYNMKIIYENRLLLNLGTESALVEKLNFLKEMILNQLPADAEGLINASDISRYLIFTEMTIKEAESGKKYTPPKIRGGAGTAEDKPEEASNEAVTESQN